MDTSSTRDFAEYLINAEHDKKAVKRLTLDHPQLTIEDGYKIQDNLIKMQIDSGYKIIGIKIGFTSRAKMIQMNIHQPIYGYLFDYMLIEDGSELSIDELIHPRVESEIAFIMKKDLEGENLSIDEVMNAVDFVAPAMEVVDSRYENFDFKLADVVADNSSSSRFILGNNRIKPQGLSLDTLNVDLSFNGEVADQGDGSAVLGHPANAVSKLAGMLSMLGKKIEAGQIILTGGITKAIPFKKDDIIETKIDSIGSVRYTVI